MRHQKLAVIALSALTTGSAAYPTSDYEDLDLYTREASLEDFENPVFHARDADHSGVNPTSPDLGPGRGFHRNSAFKKGQGDILSPYDHQLLDNSAPSKMVNGIKTKGKNFAQDAHNLFSHTSPEQLRALRSKLLGPAADKITARSDMDNEEFLAAREADYGDDSFLWNQNERRSNILEQGLNKLGIHNHQGSDSVGKSGSVSAGNTQENIMYNGHAVKPGQKHFGSESREAKQAMHEIHARSWIDDNDQLLGRDADADAEAEAEADPRFLSKVFKGGLGLRKGADQDDLSMYDARDAEAEPHFGGKIPLGTQVHQGNKHPDLNFYNRRDADADAYDDDADHLLSLREADADAYADAYYGTEEQLLTSREPQPFIVNKILKGAMALNNMRHRWGHGDGRGESSMGYGSEGGYERRDAEAEADAYADADADADADYFEDPDLW